MAWRPLQGSWRWSAQAGLFPLALASTGALSVLWGVDAPERNAALSAGYAAVIAVLAAIDVRRQVIPNPLVYPALLAVLTIAVVEPEYTLAATLGGSAVVALPFLVLFLVAPGTIGGGDVKMAALVGAMVGLDGATAALMVAALGGGVVAALLLPSRWRLHRMPYGPFLALGGFSALLTI